jgi:hypothetical protein
MKRLALILIGALLLAACSAATTPATDITQTSARLHAQVGWQQGEQGTYWFEYRVVGALTWQKTPVRSWGPMQNSASNVDLPENVTGLTPATNYEFRYCGQMSGAELCQGVQTFTTLSSGACDRNATPATLAAEVSAATAGQTVCLATGSYGTWGGTNKVITVRAAAGQTPTMGISFGSGDQSFTLQGVRITGGSISSGAQNLTVRDSEFTASLQITGLANANVLLDHNTHNNINAPSGAPPARIHLAYGSETPSGVTVRNSLLQGGDADGIQTGVGLSVINNEFSQIVAGGPNHTDNIQMVGNSTGMVIRGNWVHASASTQGIAAYDGLRNATIEDNVVDIPRPWGIEAYSDDSSVIRHNTLVYKQVCDFNLPCGIISITRKSQDDAGFGTVVRDNIATEISVTSGSTVAAQDHNMLRRFVGPNDFLGTPAFLNTTTYAGHHLAAGSPGSDAASDGLDVGIR